MLKYIKLFETTADYLEYITGTPKFPNISIAKDAPTKVYYNSTPPFFAKLTLDTGEEIELDGYGQGLLTGYMISLYKQHLVGAEIGTLCTSIGLEAFANCGYLTSIIIPNSITSIGSGAFSGCGITSIILPEGITTLSSSILSNCDKLKSVIIPSSVTSIGHSAFSMCNHLTNIISLAANAPTIQFDTFLKVSSNGILIVPSGSTGYNIWMGTGYAYLGYSNWTKVEQ